MGDMVGGGMENLVSYYTLLHCIVDRFCHLLQEEEKFRIFLRLLVGAKRGGAGLLKNHDIAQLGDQ